MLRLRDETGFTIIEISVVAFIGALLLAAAGAVLVNAVRTGLFTDGQVATLNDTRTAVERMSKEIRGADSIVWCTPTISPLPNECAGLTSDRLIVGAQTPLGGFRTVRYTKSAENLQREVFDPDTSTWSTPETIVERVMNAGSQPVFSCDTQSSLLKVNIDLSIEPTPQSDPILNIRTSVRPRNFPSKATCP